MHSTTFEYLKPTDDQIAQMAKMREASAMYAAAILTNVPPGADRTYMLRKVREVAMWGNVAITRDADGAPRD